MTAQILEPTKKNLQMGCQLALSLLDTDCPNNELPKMTKLFPYNYLKAKYKPIEMMLAMMSLGIHIIPTLELLDFLKGHVKDNKAVEICAGKVCLGRHLNVPMVDCKLQEKKEVIELYKSLGQPTIKYDNDIIQYDALEYVKENDVDLVFGSYISELKLPHKDVGSLYGVDEIELLKHCKTYITIGTDSVHGKNETKKREHTIIRDKLFFARTNNQENNFIQITKGEK